MQVQVKSSDFESFGGMNFMESDFKKFGFEPLITTSLGIHSPVAAYSYSDMLKHLLYLHIAGGEVLDDINILREQFKDPPKLSVCSADTVEYASQELNERSHSHR